MYTVCRPFPMPNSMIKTIQTLELIEIITYTKNYINRITIDMIPRLKKNSR